MLSAWCGLRIGGLKIYLKHLILIKTNCCSDLWVFDKKHSAGTIKNEIISNKKLVEQLHKPIIRKFKKRKVDSPFIDNFWDADFSRYATDK